MTILKTVLACVGATILSFNAMAANPKGETKTETTVSTTAQPASTEVNTKVTTTYFVTGLSNGIYSLSTTGSQDDCDGGDLPCQITSDANLGSSVSKADVDAHTNNIQVAETRSSYAQ